MTKFSTLWTLNFRKANHWCWIAACLILDCIVRFATFSHVFPTVSSDHSYSFLPFVFTGRESLPVSYGSLSSLSTCFSKKETSSGLGFMHQAQPAVSLKIDTNLQLKFQVCGLCYASLLLELCFFSYKNPIKKHQPQHPVTATGRVSYSRRPAVNLPAESAGGGSSGTPRGCGRWVKGFSSGPKQKHLWWRCEDVLVRMGYGKDVCDNVVWCIFFFLP